MKLAPWLAIGLITAGCTGREAQPIIVDPQPLTETPEEQPVDELPESEPETLARPTTQFDGLVAVQPSDLMTGTSRSSPSIVLGPGTEDIARSLREPGRVQLRTYPEGEEVPFEWTDGSEGYGSVTRQILIVPTRTLEARWYAIEINLDQPVTGSLRTEGRQVSRFRPDSHPVFQGVATTSRDGTHLLEARFSERVSSDVPAGAWEIEDESGPLRCTVDGPEPGHEETRATWVCDRERVGRLRIDFGGVLTTVGGEPLHDVQGEVLTRVSVGETTLMESEGVLLLR